MTEQKIFFITDSACDIPPQEEAQLDNLCILPIPVSYTHLRAHET